jgi:hypothetical protein
MKFIATCSKMHAFFVSSLIVKRPKKPVLIAQIRRNNKISFPHFSDPSPLFASKTSGQQKSICNQSTRMFIYPASV